MPRTLRSGIDGDQPHLDLARHGDPRVRRAGPKQARGADEPVAGDGNEDGAGCRAAGRIPLERATLVADREMTVRAGCERPLDEGGLGCDVAVVHRTNGERGAGERHHDPLQPRMAG